MNLNLQTNVCDPERLEAFLCGELSGAQESEFSLHLGACESCRRALQERAAEPEAWQEAEKLLRPAEFDSELESQQPSQPLQIQQVIAALGPTDDPAMLGRLGGYEVSGVVGAGGMGVVLKAVDKSLDRTVAIKVLAPHLATSGAARKRFAREAKAAAAVLHPNVIAIHSVSNEQSLPYLVMPYVRGTSLQKRLDAEGPLSLQEILRIGAQVAAGLAAAHAQGLVHRDIKPANILLEEGVERVTITDFGLARAVDDASITHSGMIAGTPQYMSPEQARGEAVDGRSDLFSLGSVLYAICTGRPPFRAETSYGVLRRITDDEPTSIREINPEIPEWLCRIITRLMSKRTDERFKTAAEVSELFERCLAHVQQPATVPLPQSCLSLRERGATFAERKATLFHPRSLGAIAMIAALALGVIGMFLWQASEAPSIAGKWAGEGWGEVLLEKQEDTSYAGTYNDTFGKKLGEIKLKWSRVERRFNGTWREGKDRFGKISVRLAGDEIRGAWRASKDSKIDPGHPDLADLAWKRVSEIKVATPDLRLAEIRTENSVLLFTMTQKDAAANGWSLQVVFESEKGFANLEGNVPQGAAVIFPQAKTAWPQTEHPSFRLPLPGSGQRMALVFPDAESATAAKEQLDAVNDGSLLESQAKSDAAKKMPAGLIHGEHANLGRFRVLFHQMKEAADSQRPPNGNHAQAKPVFGPVMERVLPYGVPCMQQYLQFRSGEVLVVGHGPATSNDEFEEDRKMVEKAGGADISLGSSGGIQLVGEGCIFTADAENLRWDTFTAEQAVNFMKRVNFSFGVMEPAVKDLPVVYLFKTSRGEVGIMEILGIVGNKPGEKVRGMKFRYKLVQQGEQARPTIETGTANTTQAELVMNLGFERNGFGSATSDSPVLLQKGRVVQASEFKAYLEKEKLSLTRQHGDAATSTTTIRLNVDRDVQFDAVTALMKLCQEVGFQKFALRLDDEAVEKFVLEILRTPFNFDESKGSWQNGAYEMQILLSLDMVRPRDRVVKTLLKVVDRSEKGTMDQRRLAMMSLGGMAPQQVIPLLIKELEGAKDLPVGNFKESFPYHEISVLEQIGEEAKDAIPILIKVLDIPDGLARQSALLALVTIGPSSDEVMNAIAARFGKSGEPVWSRAIYEVGRYGKQAKPLGPTFVKLLSATPKEARIWAAQALVTSGFDEARGFDELLKDVAAGESADRGLAATALAALGSQAKPMIPKLRAFENDPDAHVAKEVRDAIRRIEKDDRIFTHAEEAAKTRAARKAAAEALKQIAAETKAISSEAEYQRIEGTWRLVSHVVGSEVTLDEFGKDAIHDIRNRQMGDVRISLDPTKSPREIDLTFTNGPDKGKVLRGIYDWVIDARGKEFLAISVSPKLSDPGDDATHRPKDFGVRVAVDYALLERIVAKSPRGQVPQEPLGTADSRFSETKELVLSMDSSKFMLDLDTGKTMDPPATIRPEQEQMDLQTDQVQPYHYPAKLIGRGLVGVEVKSSDWDASAVDVRRALSGKAVEPLKEMDLGPEKNPTYFFKTRDGAVGVLQLLELVEKPKGIRLRYKTLKTEPVGVAANSTGAGPRFRHNFPASNRVTAVAYAEDVKLIAIVKEQDDWKRSVEILDAGLVAGKTVQVLPLTTKEEDEILAATEGMPHFQTGPLAFSPDGSVVAVGTGLGQVKLFKARTGELVLALDDEKGKLTEKRTPEKFKSLRRAMGAVNALAFSPDGSLLAMTGSSFEDVDQNWGNIRRLSLPTTGPGRLKVWDVKTGALKHDLAGHSQAFTVAFSADGSLLVSAGRGLAERGHDNGIIVWNPQTGEKLRTILIEANGGTHGIVFSPTKKLAAVSSLHFDKENDTRSTSIRLLYPLSGITQWDRKVSDWASPKAFSADGSSVAVLCGGVSIKFLSTDTAQDLHEIKAADSPAKLRWTDFALAPKSGLLTVGGVDQEGKGGVEVWEPGSVGSKDSNKAP